MYAWHLVDILSPFAVIDMKLDNRQQPFSQLAYHVVVVELYKHQNHHNISGLRRYALQLNVFHHPNVLALKIIN